MLRRFLLPRHLSCRYNSSSTKPWYVTTPIFYPNAAPHIGHLYSLVTADIFARYNRIKNPSRPVVFVTGTDEHGLKIQKAAKAQGLPPREFCDTISQQFRRLSKEADISYTRFIRTSEQAHYDAVQSIWRELDSQGLIYKGSYSGWYSVTDECFYTDAQVTHIPETPSSPARTIAKETSSPVEFSQETNYMFRLSSFRETLLQHYSTHKDAIFPEAYRTYILSILESPLEDISISRPQSRLSWGIPVPGDSEHTIYVWVDAVISYLTGIGYPWKDAGLSQGWPVDVQVIGKDIVRFHTIYLPAILQALKLPMPKRLLTHAHWTSSQKKMSKSLGNTTDPFQAMSEFGVDSVRYYLAKVGGRFRDDVDWSHSQVSKHDKELQALVGNLFMRVTSATMMSRVKEALHNSDGAAELSEDLRLAFRELSDASAALAGKVKGNLDEMEVADALDSVVDLLRLANKVLSDAAPWKHPLAHVSLESHRGCLEALRVSGICLQPFIPGVATRLLDALGISSEKRTLESAKETDTFENVQAGMRLFGARK
ncbi:methionyl-tRNA synthetase [Stygiomarasmius scandens]|uniref:methionine--tRNA ligase n=1 Tax=Marasmiellus scandens TaxID=2682957 RepID=A0ABR1K036_9AGAR